jgi:uncharacterized linocin/CFP29 family protein
MAFTRYHNIAGTSAVTTKLIARGSNANSIKSIVITNTRASNGATVDLFLQDSTGSVVKNFSILKNSEIPANFSLILDNESMISFDNDVYDLFITVGSSDTLDVLINT